VRLLNAFPIRFAVFVGSAHFLLFYAVVGAYLLVGEKSAAYGPLLSTFGVFAWPANLVPSIIQHFPFPPGDTIWVAFASTAYSLAASILFLIVRPFIRWAPHVALVRWCRVIGFLVASLLLTWLFFGVVCAFGGEFMFGIVDVARYAPQFYPGEFGFDPIRLGLSIALWALAIFASYKFIFTPRNTLFSATV